MFIGYHTKEIILEFRSFCICTSIIKAKVQQAICVLEIAASDILRLKRKCFVKPKVAHLTTKRQVYVT